MVFERTDVELAKSTVVSPIPISKLCEKWTRLVGERVEKPSVGIDNQEL
jgi:hypothetical protein